MDAPGSPQAAREGPCRFYPPTADLVFKRIFGSHDNSDLVAAFLPSLLGLPETDWVKVEFPDTHLNARFSGHKSSVFDVRVMTASGRAIDIEVQLRDVDGARERFAYYEAALLTNQPKSGNDWGTLRQAVTVIICAFTLVKESAAHHHRFQMHDADHRVPFTDVMTIHTLELPKLGADDGTSLWNWMRFLSVHDEEDMAMSTENDAAIAKAARIVQAFNADDQARYEQWCLDKAEMDRYLSLGYAHEAGLEEGRAEAREEGRARLQEAALNALRLGLAVEQVAQITGLSSTEVTSLANNQ
jgi:predicted transposase/invertase (TIGR01784 family)